MNRIAIIIFIPVLAGSITAHGQVMESMGLKAGLSLANQSHQFTSIDYTLDTEFIVGPSVALFFEAFRTEHLSFQLELAYVAKGSKTTIQSVTVNHLENDLLTVNQGDLNVSRFSYLVCSPMVRYRFERERTIPYLLLGPRLDYLLTYKTDSEYPLEEQNSFILGLHGGAGVEFRIGGLGIFGEVQYQPDLSPVTNQEPILLNNDVLLFNLGIRY